MTRCHVGEQRWLRQDEAGGVPHYCYKGLNALPRLIVVLDGIQVRSWLKLLDPIDHVIIGYGHIRNRSFGYESYQLNTIET